jgi:hypothetical protein
MKQDRFLLAILLAIGGLVVLALVLFFMRSSQQNYSTDNTPEEVVRNYILALQKGDYSRAYDYLGDYSNKPDETTFQTEIINRRREIERVAVQVGAAEQVGSQTIIPLTLIHSGNGPFGNAWREESQAVLAQDDAGAWKITSLPYTFWVFSILNKTAPAF